MWILPCSAVVLFFAVNGHRLLNSESRQYRLLRTLPAEIESRAGHDRYDGLTGVDGPNSVVVANSEEGGGTVSVECPADYMLTACVCDTAFACCDGGKIDEDKNTCTVSNDMDVCRQESNGWSKWSGYGRSLRAVAVCWRKSLIQERHIERQERTATEDGNSITMSCSAGFMMAGCRCVSDDNGCQGVKKIDVGSNSCEVTRDEQFWINCCGWEWQGQHHEFSTEIRKGQFAAESVCINWKMPVEIHVIDGVRSEKKDDALSVAPCESESALLSCSCFGTKHGCDGNPVKSATECTAQNRWLAEEGIVATGVCLKIEKPTPSPTPPPTPKPTPKSQPQSNSCTYFEANPEANARTNSFTYAKTDAESNCHAPYAKTNAESNSCTYFEANPEANARTNSFAYAKTNAESNSCTYFEANPKANARTNSFTYAKIDAESNSCTYFEANPEANARTNSFAYAKTNAESNSCTYFEANPEANARTSSFSYAKTNAESNSCTYFEADPEANTGTSSSSNRHNDDDDDDRDDYNE
eukprot:TRINITY_DN1008_c0_g1_i3.p1 TRINITY_DN1008_c0_g1~~TRINITY_DN1008_c0_g1_i3.p1  ORF type:complete len:528 (+),score=17.44 TRINITY_DN1008_c0_g1_i3:37-1620(+)